MAISQELLDILACPKCKGDIYQNDSKDGLICDHCKLLYEIRDDIPIMLIDEAKALEDQLFNMLGCVEAVKLRGWDAMKLQTYWAYSLQTLQLPGLFRDF